VIRGGPIAGPPFFCAHLRTYCAIEALGSGTALARHVPVTVEREYAREVLLRKRSEILARYESEQQTARELLRTRESDWEDLATNRREADLVETLSEADARELESIGATLRRIESGSYGVCDWCKKPIARARLDALPNAVLCADCARELEA
jgi:RNA polymerase-binding protein DksA